MNPFVDQKNIEKAAPYRTLPQYRRAEPGDASSAATVVHAVAIFGLPRRRPVLFLGGRVVVTFGRHRHYFAADDAA